MRRVGNKIKRYAHLGTGNYHRKNSLLYTDYSLLTADKTVCSDVHKVFQQITGMGKKIHPKALIHAPFNLRRSIMKMIQAEKKAAERQTSPDTCKNECSNRPYCDKSFI